MRAQAVMAATESWPEAAIAIAGIALVASVAVVVIWQAMGTWRARIEAGRDHAYQRLAEQTARDLRALAERVEAAEGDAGARGDEGGPSR